MKLTVVGSSRALVLVALWVVAGCSSGRPYQPLDGGSDSKTTPGTGGQGGEAGKGSGGAAGHAGASGTGGTAGAAGAGGAAGKGGQSGALGSGGSAGGGAPGKGGAAGGAATGGAGGGTVTCPSTQHNCNGVCVDNTSIQTCGTSCMACQPPAGATATCDGSKCGYTCPGTTPRDCGQGVCVASGACCSDTDCPTQSGGQTGTCDVGNHTCNYNCPSGTTKACTVGGTTTCIPIGSCCLNSDCTGSCMTCNSSHACVAATNEDDPNSRCAGTCDSTGTCVSKKGQPCNTTSVGCISTTVCSPDGYCCDSACTGPCVACDFTGKQGTCTALPASATPHSGHSTCTGAGSSCGGACDGSGNCSYPTSSCSSGMCSGTSYIGSGTCSAGTCSMPTAQPCGGHLVCSANACKASCTADGDCLSGYFCQTGTCHVTAVAVAAGIDHTCALLSDETVRCWGDNTYGELGQGYISSLSNPTIPTPIAVTLPKGATAIAVGAEATYALLTDGTVWAWGGNTVGQLGNGTFTAPAVGGIPTPGQVTGLPGAASGIASGTTHACAIVSGVAYCWGVDYDGELGNGEYITTGNIALATPTKVMGLSSPVTSTASGQDQTCADMNGALMCWGGNSFGEVGTGSTTVTEYDLPQYLSFTVKGPNITAVSASFGGTTCALALGGTVYCVGYNGDGELGNGSFAATSLATFAPIANGPSGAIGATAISTGGEHSCALVTGGTAYCWGENDNGELGTGNTNVTAGQDGIASPVAVTGLPFAVATISAGQQHTCAVLTNGSVWCWGYNINSQLGNNSTISAPSPVQPSGW